MKKTGGSVVVLLALQISASAQTWVSNWNQVDANTLTASLPGGGVLTVAGTEPISAGDFYNFGDQGLSTEAGGFGSLAIGAGGGSLTFSLPSGVSFEGLKIAGAAGSIRGPKFSFGSSGGSWDSNLQEVQRGLVGDTAYHNGAITNYSPFVALGNVALLNSFTLDVTNQTQTNPVGFAFSTVTTEAVPEPSSALLGALGILMGFRRRR